MTLADRSVTPGRDGIADVVTWAAEQPWWVRFGLAVRIQTEGPLSEAVLDEMASALVAHAVDGQALPGVPPAPVDAPVSHADVKLVAISGLESVNLLRDKERLPFHVAGLTVVYGDNGAGKSGYTRVLRQLVRAAAPRTSLPTTGCASTARPMSNSPRTPGVNPAHGSYGPRQRFTDLPGERPDECGRAARHGPVRDAADGRPTGQGGL